MDVFTNPFATSNVPDTSLFTTSFRSIGTFSEHIHSNTYLVYPFGIHWHPLALKGSGFFRPMHAGIVTISVKHPGTQRLNKHKELNQCKTFIWTLPYLGI